MRTRPTSDSLKLLKLLLARGYFPSNFHADSPNDAEQMSATAALAFSAISRREISATVYVAEILARARLSSNLNAIVAHIEERALDSAKKIDAALAAGTTPALVPVLPMIDSTEATGPATLTTWFRSAPSLRID